MPSFENCERHGEVLCPLCKPNLLRSINVLREFRGRLVRDRNKLTDDIAALDRMIKRAAHTVKSARSTKSKP